MVVAPARKKSPRALRHDETEQRILAAALALVAEEGFEGLSMSRLAAAVELTPGALYRYIDSKEALLSKIIDAALSDVRSFLEGALGRLPEGACPLARVLASALSYRAFARERPHEFGLLAMTMAAPRILLQDPEEAGVIAGRLVLTLAPLSRALQDAEAAGRLARGDVPERTICVFAIVQGVLQLHKQARLAQAILDLDRLAAKGVSTLLLGWGAPPSAVAAALSAAQEAVRSA